MYVHINDDFFLPHAACDIELQIAEGTCLALTGENGVGKTTLAKKIWKQSDQNTTSFIEQSALNHFYDRKLAVLKNIFLRSREPKINQKIFNELWSEFDLVKKEDRLLSSLSGGENQALKLILGLCGYHQLYIMDEPSQYLDQQKCELLKMVIERFLNDKKTFLLIEHDLKSLPANTTIVRLANVENKIIKESTWTI